MRVLLDDTPAPVYGEHLEDTQHGAGTQRHFICTDSVKRIRVL